MYPSCPRTKADFPNRNRIISGLSDAVIVTEAGEGSGALITARHAINQGKPVFAVPGAIGSESAGTNSLIKQGTPIATEPYDVISVLSLEYPETLHPYEPSLTENLICIGWALAMLLFGMWVFKRKQDKFILYI
jgi:predicted Rossmann fold nucleotide-binding protein DprA/Smf involved in DNA uptake